ncbi:MAG: sprT domain-containing protein [Crocinitomicaceae bacterium]|jgi:hypothetical protein|tara:strand:+ start:4185 stop:4808 length:624 start_codon:yes stop_codon:yes gene_type:complete
MNSAHKDIEFQNNLNKYLPKEFVSYTWDLLKDSGVHFRIVAPRKTKLGDFRAPRPNKNKPEITINGNLNPYAFLITTLHEIAHLNTFKLYRGSVKPHGLEWKHEFQQLLKPLISEKEFPDNLKRCLINSVKKTKASSCSDIDLSRELRKFDLSVKTVPLENILIGESFTLNNKSFKKGKLRRTRYLCRELNSGRNYLIHALAEVNSL